RHGAGSAGLARSTHHTRRAPLEKARVYTWQPGGEPTSSGVSAREDRVEDARREVRALPVGMPPVRIPQIEAGSPSQSLGPGEPGRRNRRRQLGAELGIAAFQPTLHAGEGVAGPVVPVTVLVAPCHEEERAPAAACDLL